MIQPHLQIQVTVCIVLGGKLPLTKREMEQSYTYLPAEYPT